MLSFSNSSASVSRPLPFQYTYRTHTTPNVQLLAPQSVPASAFKRSNLTCSTSPRSPLLLTPFLTAHAVDTPSKTHGTPVLVALTPGFDTRKLYPFSHATLSLSTPILLSYDQAKFVAQQMYIPMLCIHNYDDDEMFITATYHENIHHRMA